MATAVGEAGGARRRSDGRSARARAKVTEVLETHHPVYIDPMVDGDLCARFPIKLPADAMRARAQRTESQTG